MSPLPTPLVESSPDVAAVTVRALSFQRGERTIFDRVDLDIPRGKVTAIMGPSGTGKTTARCRAH